MNAAPAPLRHALLVTHGEATQRLCHETLAQAGFIVDNSIDSGASAVTVARDVQPSVIILNHQLSDVGALEAVKWLRSNAALKATPIIILGGKAEDEAREQWLLVLPRPITAAGIRKALGDALGAASAALEGRGI